MKRGISLRSVARHVGVSASLISQIETGKCQPSVSTLYAITTSLGVSIQDAFERADEPPPRFAAAAVCSPAAAPSACALSPSAPSPAAAPYPVRAPAGSLAPARSLAPAESLAPARPLPAAEALAALAAARRPGVVTGAGEREVLRLDSGVTWERLGHVPGVQVDFLLVTYAPGRNVIGRRPVHAARRCGVRLLDGR